MLESGRKSVEAIANKVSISNAQSLQQFISDAPWRHQSLQLALVEFMQQELLPDKNGSVLILDDTSFPKKGDFSPGVAKQYCGALGKVANCQILVSWHYAEGRPRLLHFPLLSQLYLPKEWTSRPERLRRAKVPESKWKYDEKWHIALTLLDQVGVLLPHEACIFDAVYGEIREFLGELDARGETFIGQIPESHSFWNAGIALSSGGTGAIRMGRRIECLQARSVRAKPLSAIAWYQKLELSKESWHTIRLRDQGKTVVEVAAVRVREKVKYTPRGVGPERWLLIEKYLASAQCFPEMRCLI